MPMEFFAKPQTPLFGAHIEPRCEYCAEGGWNAAHSAILCPRLGVMRPTDHCDRFDYDPLRREPKREPKLPDYDPADFTL